MAFAALGERGAATAAEAELFRNTLRAALCARLSVWAPEEFTASCSGGFAPQSHEVHFPLLHERLHSLVGLERGEVRREPVARVPDGGVPRHFFPVVHLLLGVASALGKLLEQLLDERRDFVVELG